MRGGSRDKEMLVRSVLVMRADLMVNLMVSSIFPKAVCRAQTDFAGRHSVLVLTLMLMCGNVAWPPQMAPGDVGEPRVPKSPRLALGINQAANIAQRLGARRSPSPSGSF